MVYLLHFDKPYRHARHYLGYARLFERRLAEHMAGRGARLMAAVSAAGIGVTLVRKWPDGDRTFERELHNLKRNALLCPVCTTHPLPIAARPSEFFLPSRVTVP